MSDAVSGKSGAAVLRLKGVTRIYKQAAGDLVVFRDVSLALAPGEIVALVGPSGAGKSSLLHIAGLLEAPSEGEVYIDEAPASQLPERDRTRVRRDTLGFVYQFHHLLPEFSALENVSIPRRIAGVGRRDAEAEAARLLGLVGLAERVSHRPAQLSGASSNASRSPARSPTGRACSWPTSPPATSIPAPPIKCLPCSSPSCARWDCRR